MGTSYSQLLQYLKSKDPKSLPYSSNQLFTLLDVLLNNAVERIIENSDFVDRVFSSIIAWYNTNKRRKISKYNRETTVSVMIAYIKTNDIELKKELYKSLCIERSVSFLIIKQFLDICKDYTRLLEDISTTQFPERSNYWERIYNIEVSVSYRKKSNNDLYGVLREITYWFELYGRLKNGIMEKYYRYIFTQVIRESKRSTVKVDIDDMAQNYVVATSKAVDKFLSDKGTFKSYLDHWIKDAKTAITSGHYYGLAFVTPDADYSNIGVTNIAVSLDQLLSDEGDDSEIKSIEAESPEELAIVRSHHQRIRALANYADPLGFAVESFGLKEIKL